MSVGRIGGFWDLQKEVIIEVVQGVVASCAANRYIKAGLDTGCSDLKIWNQGS